MAALAAFDLTPSQMQVALRRTALRAAGEGEGALTHGGLLSAAQEMVRRRGEKGLFG